MNQFENNQDNQLYKKAMRIDMIGNIIIIILAIIIFLISSPNNYRLAGILTSINFCIAFAMKSYVKTKFIEFYKQIYIKEYELNDTR